MRVPVVTKNDREDLFKSASPGLQLQQDRRVSRDFFSCRCVLPLGLIVGGEPARHLARRHVKCGGGKFSKFAPTTLLCCCHKPEIVSPIMTPVTIFRNLGALLLGLVLGSVANMALIMLNVSYLFPLPEGVTMEDTEAFREYIGSLPITAFVVVFMAHFSQVIVGGYTAARLGTMDNPLIMTQALALLTMVGSIMNNLSLQVPNWTWVELPFFPLLGWLVASKSVTPSENLANSSEGKDA